MRWKIAPPGPQVYVKAVHDFDLSILRPPVALSPNVGWTDNDGFVHDREEIVTCLTLEGQYRYVVQMNDDRLYRGTYATVTRLLERCGQDWPDMEV